MKSLQWLCFFPTTPSQVYGTCSGLSPGSGAGAYPSNCNVRAMYASPNAVCMRAAPKFGNIFRGSCDQVHTLTFAFVAAMEALRCNPATLTLHSPEPMVKTKHHCCVAHAHQVIHPRLTQSLAQLASVDLGCCNASSLMLAVKTWTCHTSKTRSWPVLAS